LSGDTPVQNHIRPTEAWVFFLEHAGRPCLFENLFGKAVTYRKVRRLGGGTSVGNTTEKRLGVAGVVSLAQ